MLVEFNVKGMLRFLSHAETMTMLQRACIRAGLRLAYSAGFNPRPKISLPFPRTVGVESYGDLLVAQALDEPLKENCSENCRASTTRLIDSRLKEQVPAGIEIETVRTDRAKVSLQPVRTVYVVVLKEQNNNLPRIAQRITESEELKMERHGGRKKKKKVKDVRPFIESIDIEGPKVHISCGITPYGTVRVDELMELLQLEPDMLEQPVKRMYVQWNNR